MDAVAIVRQIEGRTGLRVTLNGNSWATTAFMAEQRKIAKNENLPLLMTIEEDRVPTDNPKNEEMLIRIGVHDTWFEVMIDGARHFRTSEFKKLKKELGLSKITSEEEVVDIVTIYGIHLETA